MPYRTISVKAPLFLQHKGIKIYHTFKDDDADNCRLDYWYSFYSDNDETMGDANFDVRDLSTWKEPEHPSFLDELKNDTPENRKAWITHQANEKNVIKQAIRNAIDKGELKPVADVA